ncbi:DUF2157 domain-containing protein [Hymenobacter siberiensis]|uniref:DUF2157 domain-containing protein n=1 Tax=Hymenobacter siberiensis TaxID=2848396 RepID=UPI001C1DD8D2|nr:DUF2157 domain-containing protein [Hymenobacter siberiensis]MBU6119342.1 DUF2157 domain-containing protein [Hymenobacter siberiensis]
MPSPPPSTLYLADLQSRGLLPPTQTTRIIASERTQPFSLHYELRALLYLGITLLAGGLDVLVYQHINTIGHGIIIALIAALMAACFTYAAPLPSPGGVASKTSVGADYLLLATCCWWCWWCWRVTYSTNTSFSATATGWPRRCRRWFSCR